jgi:hypothetical protein
VINLKKLLVLKNLYKLSYADDKTLRLWDRDGNILKILYIESNDDIIEENKNIIVINKNRLYISVV